MKKKPKSVDAIAMLKADHRQVAKWFAEFDKARAGNRREKLAAQICAALRVHTKIEEEIFYPAFIAATGDKPLHHEAVVEHAGAKKLIGEIESSDSRDDYFEAKVTVLSEMIKHHVKEEEQRDGMFAQAKKGDIDLDAIGAALAARKQEVIAKFAREGVPPPKTRVMKGADLERGEPVEA